MKKRYLSVALLCAMLAMGSCTDDVLLDNNNTETVAPQEKVIISVGMPQDDDDSRVAYDDAKQALTWQEGDTLIVRGLSAEGWEQGYEKLGLVSGAGTKQAKFAGILPVAVYYEVEVMRKQTTLDGRYIQIQAGDGSTAHLDGALILCSSKDVHLSETDLTSGNIALELQSSILRVNVKKLPEGMKAPKTLVWTTVNRKGQVCSQSLGLRNIQPQGGGFTAYVVFDPQVMELGNNRQTAIQVSDGSQIYYCETTSVTGKLYEAGKRYTLDTNAMTEWTKLQIPNNEIWVGEDKYHGGPLGSLTLSEKPNIWGYRVAKKADNSPITLLAEGDLPYSCRSVILPEGLTDIGDGALSDGDRLTEVILPSTLKRIGVESLCYTYINSIVLPEGLESIGDQSLSGLSVSELYVPASLTSIGSGVFSDCPDLERITGPMASADGRLLVKDNAVLAYASKGAPESLVLPEGTTAIGDMVFYECKNITSVTLPEGLKSIGMGAFYGVENLASLKIPQSVETLGACCFDWCNKLTKFEGKFASADGKFLINQDENLVGAVTKGVSHLVVPAGVKKYLTTTFAKSMELTEVTFPEGMNEVFWIAFWDCTNLKKVTFPATANGLVLGFECFEHTGLTEITLPKGTAAIGNGLLFGCDKLETVTVNATPETLTNIEEDAFDGIPTGAVLRINQAWKTQITDNRWGGINWQSIIFIDDNGNEIAQ